MKTITHGSAAFRSTSQSGFSLLEVIVATSLLIVAVASLAQVFVISVRANASARATTYASVLAQQKMEQLRGLTWGFDTLGLPLTDTTTDVSVTPETAAGRGLSPSPAGAGTLGVNTDGYCDFLDGSGRWLAGGATVPAGAIFVRRWSVEPLPTNPNNTVVLQVLVTRHRALVPADAVAGAARTTDEARLVSVKTRKAP